MEGSETYSPAPALIGVHLALPHFAPPPLSPDPHALKSVLGVLLFQRLMFATLMREQLVAENLEGKLTSGSTGVSCDDCLFIAFVKDANAAAAALKSELAEIVLLQSAKIGAHDSTAWRCLHPSPSVRLDWIMGDQEQRAAAFRDAKAACDAESRRLEDLKRNQNGGTAK